MIEKLGAVKRVIIALENVLERLVSTKPMSSTYFFERLVIATGLVASSWCSFEWTQVEWFSIIFRRSVNKFQSSVQACEKRDQNDCQAKKLDFTAKNPFQRYSSPFFTVKYNFLFDISKIYRWCTLVVRYFSKIFGHVSKLSDFFPWKSTIWSVKLRLHLLTRH